MKKPLKNKARNTAQRHSIRPKVQAAIEKTLEQIHLTMRRSGKTQNELAREAAISASHLSKILSGQVIPGYDKMLAILDAADTPVTVAGANIMSEELPE